MHAPLLLQGAVAALAMPAMAKPVVAPNKDLEEMERSDNTAIVRNRQWWSPSPRPTVPSRPRPTVNGGLQYTTFLIPYEVPDFTKGGVITKYITATAPIVSDTGPFFPPGMIIPLTEAPTPAVEKRQPAPTAFMTAAKAPPVG